MDEITEMADRALEKVRRGEELGLEFEIDWASRTDEERDDFMSLQSERIAHRKKRLEAIEAQNRALKELLRLQVRSAPGMSLQEAIGSGQINMLEVVEAIQGMAPDPLAK